MKTDNNQTALPGNEHERETKDFKSLSLKENHDINNADGNNGRCPECDKASENIISSIGNTGEPWVAFTPHDRVGLALSGGGIRSATFNLGLMQALVKKGLLKRVDYLATVSGGGFIGGFWTRWWCSISRINEKGPQVCIANNKRREFPEAFGGANVSGMDEPKEIREPDEIRHLREFSRYLLPRRGLNRDLWSAVVSVLSGLMPSLIAALALVLFIVTMWVLLAGLMLILTNTVQAAQNTPEWIRLSERSILFLTSGLLAILVGAGHVITGPFEQFDMAPSNRRAYTKYYFIWSILGVVLISIFWICWDCFIIDPSSALSLNDIEAPDSQYHFNYFLFGPSIVLMTTLLILKMLNLVRMRIVPIVKRLTLKLPSSLKAKIANSKSIDPDTERSVFFSKSLAFERVMGFLLIILVAWAAMGGIWELARWLNMKAALGEHKAFGVGGVSAVLAMLFAWARSWLTKPMLENQVSEKFIEWLKPRMMQILANLTVVSFFVLAALFILDIGFKDSIWPILYILSGSLIVLLLALLLFDPREVGLHEFYRARLTRCYLRAGNTNARDCQKMDANHADSTNNEKCWKCLENKTSEFMESPKDDMFLCADAGLPIHLICCAANHLWGDPLSTLNRGARSAVLSRNGIAIGNSWIEDQGLRLSSAMTASAAAFNSLMGEVNMKVGQAVAFVMTALNLRLGLWVKNPAYPKDKKVWGQWLPGLLFFKELFGHAQCFTDERAASHMHLSDGGHFENLALYELIRRHCRYIIVSDAGEDEAFDFTDFGRAARRVREDFGVEIEIDLRPLKPGPDGFSRQHIAVGTIHYDNIEGMDKGTIVYFKPTLTNDEPVDVLQYRQCNPHFPHESTGDQFYDEAQWESYRRLGEHTGYAGLRVLDQAQCLSGDLPPDKTGSKEKSNETLFREIRLAWYRVPWVEGEGGIRLNEKEADLEKALTGMRSGDLRCEFLEDIICNATISTNIEQTVEDILMAIRALKFIEEAWFTCELDRYWSHPLANNWMSYLQRWAAMPTLQNWWPLLKSLFGASKGFVTFAEDQLNLPKTSPANKKGQDNILELKANPCKFKSGYAWERFIKYHPDKDVNSSNLTCFSLELSLSLPGQCLNIQVGVGLIKEVTKTGIPVESYASWCCDDLFVPPELQGCGFTTTLLDRIIEHYKNKKSYSITRLKVQMENCPGKSSASPVNRRDPAWRQKQIELIDFYRSRGFKLELTSWIREGQSINMSMHLH